MSAKKERKAIIFDLDGTLWDSTGEIYKIWNQVFERYPEIKVRVTCDGVKKLMGKTMEEIGEALFPDQDGDFQKKIMDECALEEVIYLQVHGAVLYKGVKETLEILNKDHDLFVVSNSQDGYVDSFITAHGFGAMFKDIEMSGRTGLGKGANIRLIMDRNRVSQAVYVGDTRGDEEAAREADIPFIYAAYGFGTADRPDGVIHKISDLPGLV